jgi:hypothetical protein
MKCLEGVLDSVASIGFPEYFNNLLRNSEKSDHSFLFNYIDSKDNHCGIAKLSVNQTMTRAAK